MAGGANTVTTQGGAELLHACQSFCRGEGGQVGQSRWGDIIKMMWRGVGGGRPRCGWEKGVRQSVDTPSQIDTRRQGGRTVGGKS